MNLQCENNCIGFMHSRTKTIKMFIQYLRSKRLNLNSFSLISRVMFNLNLYNSVVFC